MLHNEFVLKQYSSSIIVGSIVLMCSFLLSLLKVQNISCLENGKECDAATYTLLEPLKHSSFFFSNSQNELSTYYNGIMPFNIVDIKKELPGRYIVSVQDQPALYALYQEQTQTITHGVSENGSYVSIQDQQVLPVIKVASLESLGMQQQLETHFHTTIQTILQHSSKTYHLETIVYTSPTEIYLHYQNLPPVLITDSVPVYALQHIEKLMYTVESQSIQRPIKEIDLRFRLPVLRTET